MAHKTDAGERLGDAPLAISGTTESAFGKPQDHEELGGLKGIPSPLDLTLDPEQQCSMGYKGAVVPFLDSRRESSISSSGINTFSPRTPKFEDISVDYQARYLTEQMARLSPLDRKVWYREDICVQPESSQALAPHTPTADFLPPDPPLSPSESTSEAVYSSSLSSITSESPLSSPTPVIHVTAPSQSTTPKPEPQLPNSSRPRRKSEVSRNIILQDTKHKSRAQSVGARPKGVRFADEPLISPSSSIDSGSMPGYVGGPIHIAATPWGVLYRNGQPTERWRRFLRDIGRGIARDGLVRPADMYNFYREFPNGDDPHRFREMFHTHYRSSQVQQMYNDLGIEYEMVFDHHVGQPQPCLTADSFAQWMIFLISAYPSQEAKRLAAIAQSQRFKSGVHSQTAEPQLLPSIFPLHLIPTEEVVRSVRRDRLRSVLANIWPDYASSRPFVVQPSLPDSSGQHRHRERRASDSRVLMEVPPPPPTSRARLRDSQRYIQDIQRAERCERAHRDSYRTYWDDAALDDYRPPNPAPQPDRLFVLNPRTGQYHPMNRSEPAVPPPRERRHSRREDRGLEYPSGRRGEVHSRFEEGIEDPVDYFRRARHNDQAHYQDWARYQIEPRDTRNDRAYSPLSPNEAYYRPRRSHRESGWRERYRR